MGENRAGDGRRFCLRMNVVIVTICYPPEIRSISNMVRELADALVHRGHTVTVLTGWPQYNLSEDDRARTFQQDTTEKGVRVIRIKTLPTHRVPYVLRGIGQVLLPFLFMRAFKKRVRGAVDAVVVYSPHLPLAAVGTKIKVQCGARYLLNIQDIFPQNAIDLNVLTNKRMILFFENMERRAYAAADVITTCTNNARQFLIDHKSVPPEKVTWVPNWIDTEPYEGITATGVFRKKYGLENKFIILFAGVLGPSQGLDFVIDVARKVSDIQDLVFLFVGDGTERDRTQKLAREYELKNVQFEPFVSPDVYPILLKEVDVGLLALKNDSGTPTVPGKFFGFCAARLPVVAFLNKESEGHRLIQESGCGYAVVSDDIDTAAALVRKVYTEKDRLHEWGDRGFVYVREYFSKEKCIDQLEKLITT